jgi:hypothetical protein
MDADTEQLEQATRISYARLSENEHVLRQLLVLLEKIAGDTGFEQLSGAVQDVTEAARDQLAAYLDDKIPLGERKLH